MNFNWPHRGGSALSDRTTAEADTRMKAIKRASKTLIKSVEESLRTYSKHQDIEIRKKKSTEFILGENLAGAVQCLSSDGKINEHWSPFNTVLERYANFEKTIGHMLATNDQEIAF